MNEFTDKLFLLGSPGCGKTFYLEYLEKYFELSAKQLDLIKYFTVGEYLEL